MLHGGLDPPETHDVEQTRGEARYEIYFKEDHFGGSGSGIQWVGSISV
jgi:hypothetical protein